MVYNISKTNGKRILQEIEYCKDKKEFIYNNNSKFINVPLSAYEFSIGNYQVIKNYLKYIKGK
ncbi:type ISP restriction/modification enzyme [Borrelia miyamotoi]|uniref:type ISP restriction/modification enzyme n=1 Tax=Borrelia miyamotoi TaxID=47466 RepID=UPI00087A26EA|nr:type ISP restriction/modification enzyme [Borrelia miyamotoi]AOW96291.1 hypothetical protein AXH25_04750 [Borrelia miyamotoi]QTL84175.1 hypothetical protein bmLB2001_001096 [Borrelia miyamotoi]WAZ94190.1 hypothetical protein O5399_05640 [Borrelia miyamotoi]